VKENSVAKKLTLKKENLKKLSVEQLRNVASGLDGSLDTCNVLGPLDAGTLDTCNVV